MAECWTWQGSRRGRGGGHPTPAPTSTAGNHEGAKIYAQNAIRKKAEALNYLRLASRLDAVVSRLDTQAKMQVGAGRVAGKGLVPADHCAAPGLNDEMRPQRHTAMDGLACCPCCSGEEHDCCEAGAREGTGRPSCPATPLLGPLLPCCQIVNKSMAGIVKSLDAALKANNLEKVAATMDQFEKQFENLDVQSEFVEQAMGNQAALSTPEEDVNLLMQARRLGWTGVWQSCWVAFSALEGGLGVGDWVAATCRGQATPVRGFTMLADPARPCLTPQFPPRRSKSRTSMAWTCGWDCRRPARLPWSPRSGSRRQTTLQTGWRSCAASEAAASRRGPPVCLGDDAALCPCFELVLYDKALHPAATAGLTEWGRWPDGRAPFPPGEGVPPGSPCDHPCASRRGARDPPKASGPATVLAQCHRVV